MRTAELAILATVAAAFVVAPSASAAAAPAPSGKTSACTLPNGAEILAPEATGTAQQYYTYYYSYRWVYYSTYYYRYCYCGRKLLQTQAAPSPSSAPRCCPTTTSKQGDTVSGLISSAGLPADSSVFFYAINPSVSNSTDTIPAGTTVTTPCFRITEYYRLADANAPAPAVAATGK